MTNSTKHFIGPIRPIKDQVVKGIGEAKIFGKGTIRWHIDDDEGVVHEITIKNALYVPNLPICLM